MRREVIDSATAKRIIAIAERLLPQQISGKRGAPRKDAEAYNLFVLHEQGLSYTRIAKKVGKERDAVIKAVKRYEAQHGVDKNTP